jgi:XTP/dITP diphosphohydrolase
MHSRKEQLESFEKILDIMDELREKCPWDKKQTFDSIRNLTIEETYELVEAIDQKNWDDIKKESGDILLHIVFYAKMGSELKKFDIKDVIDGLCEKLIFRHPHVFGEENVNGSSEKVKENWEAIKQKEGLNKRVLGGVPSSLPALIKALRIQDKARSIGFDWDKKEQVWDKVEEEIEEFKNELIEGNKEKAEAEFGDVLFSLVNAARLYGIEPETALERTNKKFIKRFNYLEDNTIRKGKKLKEMNLNEMNEIWEKSKKEMK